MRNSFKVMVFLFGIAWWQASLACSVRFPELEPKFSEFKELGTASFSFLFWDLYKSALYVKGDKFAKNFENTLFEIRYQRNIDKHDLIEQTIAQWQHLKLPHNSYQSYIPKLETIWPNVKKGDTLALLVDEDSSHFYLNRACIGTIEDPDFGHRFLDIWLSPNTSAPKQRKRLLGL